MSWIEIGYYKVDMLKKSKDKIQFIKTSWVTLFDVLGYCIYNIKEWLSKKGLRKNNKPHL